MAAPNEVYVDPSIAGDSGTGSSGSPYGDLEYCLEQITPNANGDRINIKAGTDEVLEFALDITTDYGTPTEAAPLIFQGYTSTAGDGGVGGISGGTSVAIVNNTSLNYVSFIDLHLHSTGSNNIITLNDNCNVIRCELDNSTGTAIDLDNFGAVVQNYIHNIGTTGVQHQNILVGWNYFENGTNDFNTAIRVVNNTICFVYRNIINLTGAANTSDGIWMAQNSICLNNTVWCDAGSGEGIKIGDAGSQVLCCMNNIVEGFSATNGDGFDSSATGSYILYGGNAAYNNDTEYDSVYDYVIDTLGSGSIGETLSASPFIDAANGDFRPVNTGNVRHGSLPSKIGEAEP